MKIVTEGTGVPQTSKVACWVFFFVLLLLMRVALFAVIQLSCLEFQVQGVPINVCGHNVAEGMSTQLVLCCCEWKLWGHGGSLGILVGSY